MVHAQQEVQVLARAQDLRAVYPVEQDPGRILGRVVHDDDLDRQRLAREPGFQDGSQAAEGELRLIVEHEDDRHLGLRMLRELETGARRQERIETAGEDAA